MAGHVRWARRRVARHPRRRSPSWASGDSGCPNRHGCLASVVGPEETESCPDVGPGRDDQRYGPHVRADRGPGEPVTAGTSGVVGRVPGGARGGVAGSVRRLEHLCKGASDASRASDPADAPDALDAEMQHCSKSSCETVVSRIGRVFGRPKK